jgi:hypothetical protein
MTYLTYNLQLRKESDANVISNLLRKGWKEAPPPSYDINTQFIEWVNGDWVVKPIQLSSAVVSMRSFREACGRELMIQINAFVASIEDLNERFKAQTDLEFATTVSRAHPRVAQVAAALNKTDAEIDQVFINAQQLDAS